MRLLATRPFHAEGVLTFLASRTVPGLDAVSGSTYARTREGVEVHVDDDGADIDGDDHVPRARRLLDLDADVDDIASVLGADPALAPLVAATPGLRVPGAWEPFEIAVRAVVGQQVTVAAARTLLGRVLARCEGALDPAVLATADLTALGMPASRTGALQALARAVVAGDASLDEPPSLLAVRGIGPWTAAYIGMRLGDRDAFPIGDVVLRSAAGARNLPTDDRKLLAHAEGWRPYRAYATIHLWRASSTSPMSSPTG